MGDNAGIWAPLASNFQRGRLVDRKGVFRTVQEKIVPKEKDSGNKL
jgi:hypothetical protein